MNSLPRVLLKNCKIALIQHLVSASKAGNLASIETKLRQVASQGSNIALLPECFNSPYGNAYFNQYAEDVDSGGSETTRFLARMASELQIYIIGGSIPERSGGRLYNTCLAFDRAGQLIGKHRKMHLFDIDIPGKIRFKESETLTAGHQFTLINTEYGKIGIGICYDMRFPEMALLAAQQGCFMMVYPGAFNMTTGPLHFNLLLKARAVDNQMIVAGISPAFDSSAKYQAYGHSAVYDAFAQPLAEAGSEECIIYADLDANNMHEQRCSIPIHAQKRPDCYQLQDKTKQSHL